MSDLLNSDQLSAIKDLIVEPLLGTVRAEIKPLITGLEEVHAELFRTQNHLRATDLRVGKTERIRRSLAAGVAAIVAVAFWLGHLFRNS